MSNLRWIQASAHYLPMLADESVQMIATSPPFFGLRAYAGEQAVEWPTVEYSPMAGLPPIRIQGCAAECSHEWVDGQTIKVGRNDENPTDLQRRFEQYGSGRPKAANGQNPTHSTQGAYCLHCDGWRGGLGLEPTIEMYIGHLILCLREWRRILRSDGTCWVNLADCYAGGGELGRHDKLTPESFVGNDEKWKGKKREYRRSNSGLPAKNLCLIPARFALAAQADGWWVRSDIIWAKPNPMPESVTDRPTRSYEHIFMLAKSERYFFDAEAIREKNAPGYQEMPVNGPGIVKMRKRPPEHDNAHISMAAAREYNGAGRNRRDVWTVATQPTPFAHFATWPERLVETMIRAGTSARGACPQCGTGWLRVVEKTGERATHGVNHVADQMHAHEPLRNNGTRHGTNSILSTGLVGVYETTGWQPACACNAGDAVPCVILDPFAGSGTSLRVAAKLGRQGIGVDISQTYIEEIAPLRMGAGVQMELSY